MNLLQTELFLFWEIGKIYEEHNVLLRIIPKTYGKNKNRCYILLANNEIIFKSFIVSKETLLKILQDKYDGLYSDKYSIIMQKVRQLAPIKVKA